MMATPTSPSLKRTRALRSHRPTPASHGGSVSPSPRRGSVTFDTQTSVYHPSIQHDDHQPQGSTLTQTKDDEDDEVGTKVGYSGCLPCQYLVERRWARRFFRVLAVFNLTSLIFASPLKLCSGEGGSGDDCKSVRIQFGIIACVDFILAVIYTFQTILRIEYSIYLRKNPQAAVRFESDGTPKRDLKGYTQPFRLIMLALVTLSLWYSFAIGVYRSVALNANPLFWAYYIPFAFRSLVTITAMKLFVHLKLPSATALSGLFGRIKWKQLGIVILFYMFFVYIFALVGVQWIGGMSERCTYTYDNGTSNTTLLSVPLTHCTSDNDSRTKSCYNDQNMQCMGFPTESTPLNINFRDTVYLGQFRFMLDSIFAVYEASSLELWFFMENASIDGAPRSLLLIWLFYITLVFFLVFFVQQSIFLVVIIESFADLRSDSITSQSSSESKDKPVIVLYEQPGSADDKEKLRFKTLKNQESTANFRDRLNLYYFQVIEKVFIVFVLIDAIVVSTKHTGMPPVWASLITYWQISVSILFVLEIAGLFVVHVFTSPNQVRLFFRTPYYWYLIVLALGGLVAIYAFYEAGNFAPKNVLAIFQALRLFRVLRLVPSVKRFFLKIIGNGVKLLVVILIVLVFMGWFAIVSMQFFGYLEPAEGCGRIGSDQFRDVIHALQSMFQLVMQEGWSQLTSEIMCHRDGSWIIINFYFILLHLCASLILLNFFVAVILDNLDDDEETKTEKLEKELNTRKVERVPRHLKVFKLSGPKRIPVPKLSSVDVPNLTETDVRNFYNIGENTDFPTTYIPEHLPTVHDSYFQRRTSELSNLELLTEDKSVSSRIQSHEGKYIGIQGILSYVKAFRQYSREKESVKRGQETSRAARPAFDYWGGVASGQGESSLLVQSEYDEYREKYRLFDSALFCMPPEHKLRRFCHTILTYQCDTPEGSLFSRKALTLRQFGKRLLYALRYIVSRLPYFGWIMVIITLASVSILIYEFVIDIEKQNPTYIWWLDLLFVFFTLMELVLKILANGLFFNPNAAIASVWDVLDWLIVMATLTVMTIYLSSCGHSFMFAVTLGNASWWMQALLFCRVLRPLRLISLIPSMRRVLYDVILGWRNIVLGAVLLFFFMFLFASLGVQLFAGEGSKEAFCNDPNMESEKDCIGHFYINIELSPNELLPTNDHDFNIHVPRVWYDRRRDFSFKHVGFALLTLFEVLTLEGWLDVRDMFGSIDHETGINWIALYMNIYIHTFIFFGVNIGLQLFVGIVVNNFNEHKPDHSALLTVSQKRWTDLVQRISLTRPIKLPPPPRNNKIRLFLYKVFVSSIYRHILTAVIFFNSFILFVPWVEKPELHTTAKVLLSIFIAFAAFYIFELLLKLAAFGVLKYFQSWRNMFDFLVSLLAFCYIVCAAVYLVDHSLIPLPKVADIALVLSLLKLFTVLMRYSSMQNLLITVGQTIYRGLSLIGVLITTIVTYSLVSTLFFNTLRSGQAVDYALVNFNGVFTSSTLFVRIVTGEDWHHLLWDAMVDEPYCSSELGNCGNLIVASFSFISYYLIVTFILLNVVIAVLLENFSIFYNEDDTELSHAVVKDFKQNWLFFDKDASGFIQSSRIKLFLRMLRLQQFHTYQINENGIKERKTSDMLTDPLLLREMAEELQRDPKQQGIKPDQSLVQRQQLGEEVSKENHSFQNVLKLVAYRAENISKRLVPHELYTREELEKSVQFDVAEDCILKWMQCFVDPVIKRQEKRRRPTIYQASGFRKYAERSVLWDTPEIEGTEDTHSDDLALSAAETEDESEAANLPLVSLSRIRSQPSEVKSDEELELDDLTDKAANPALAKSFARLEKAPLVHFKQGTEEKWHHWFKMQKEWMDNVESDPDNYFDDYL